MQLKPDCMIQMLVRYFIRNTAFLPDTIAREYPIARVHLLVNISKSPRYVHITSNYSHYPYKLQQGRMRIYIYIHIYIYIRFDRYSACIETPPRQRSA